MQAPRPPALVKGSAHRAFQKLRDLDPDAAPGERVFKSQRKDPADPEQNKPLTVRGVQELLCHYADKLGWERLHPISFATRLRSRSESKAHLSTGRRSPS